MVFHSFDELNAHIRQRLRPRRVVVAGAADRHALEAVLGLWNEGVLCPLLVGERGEITRILDELDTEGVLGTSSASGALSAAGTAGTSSTPSAPDTTGALSAAGTPAAAKIDGLEILDASSAVEAATLAVQAVREGKADFIMKGRMETSDILRAVVNKDHGLSRGRSMSHLALNQIPAYHKLLVTTDGGMMLCPTLEQKKDIIVNAVEALRCVGYAKPKVGVLAASETVNEKSRDSIDAAALRKMWEDGEIGDCLLEGPLSLDIALVRERAAAKGYDSPCAGDVDMLVVPNITAGNILGKSLVEMAGAKMAGLVVGARCPIVITSRGSSSEEKYNALMLAVGLTAKGGVR
jgi:phosphate butyryltransferase